MHMFIRNLFNVHSTFIAAYELTELNQALCKESREALWKGHEYDTAPEKVLLALLSYTVLHQWLNVAAHEKANKNCFIFNNSYQWSLENNMVNKTETTRRIIMMHSTKAYVDSSVVWITHLA